MHQSQYGIWAVVLLLLVLNIIIRVTSKIPKPPSYSIELFKQPILQVLWYAMISLFALIIGIGGIIVLSKVQPIPAYMIGIAWMLAWAQIAISFNPGKP